MSRLRKRQNAIQREEYAFRAAWSAAAQRKRNKSGPHTPQELATRGAKANPTARYASVFLQKKSFSVKNKRFVSLLRIGDYSIVSRRKTTAIVSCGANGRR
jgi:hypothetical protein